MNHIDIIFLLFTAVLIVTGVLKGFVKTVIDFVSGLISFVAALILARPIAGILADMTYFDPARQRIEGFFNERASGAAQTVSNALKDFSVPEFIKEYMIKGLPDPSTLMADGVKYISQSFFTLMLTAIVFVVILIIVRMIFFFLSKSIESLFKKVKVLKTTDRFLGGILGAANAMFIVFVVLAVLAMTAAKLPSLTDAVSNSLIVSWLYQDNLLLRLFH